MTCSLSSSRSCFLFSPTICCLGADLVPCDRLCDADIVCSSSSGCEGKAELRWEPLGLAFSSGGACTTSPNLTSSTHCGLRVEAVLVCGGKAGVEYIPYLFSPPYLCFCHDSVPVSWPLPSSVSPLAFYRTHHKETEIQSRRELTSLTQSRNRANTSLTSFSSRWVSCSF